MAQVAPPQHVAELPPSSSLPTAAVVASSSSAITNVEELHSSQSPSPTNGKLEGDALMEALRKQIEFYFSRQNIANDAYLVSQMNAQKYVSVDVIAGFPKIRNMTSDRDLIVKVMRSCANCHLDEEAKMVKPNVKTERTTLILRDVPESTPVEEVRAIFSADGCGRVVSSRPDIHDTWFISFESEEEAKKTVLALMGQTFKGKPVRVGMKSENLLRGYFYAPTNVSTTDSSASSAGAPPGGWVGGPNGYYDPNANSAYGYPYWNQYPPYQQGGYVQQQGGFNKGDGNSQNRGNKNRKDRGGGGHSGGAGTPTAVAANTSSAPGGSTSTAAGSAAGVGAGSDQGQNARRKGKKVENAAHSGMNGVSGMNGNTVRSGQHQQQGGGGTHGGRGKKNQQFHGQHSQAKTNGAPQPQLGPEHFPALPASTKKTGGGYTRPFLQYSREAMARVVDELSAHGVTKPASLNFPGCIAISDQPLSHSHLLQPFPIMFPASPSPLLSAAPVPHGMPDLDLGRHAAGHSPSFRSQIGSALGVQLGHFSPSLSSAPVIATLNSQSKSFVPAPTRPAAESTVGSPGSSVASASTSSSFTSPLTLSNSVSAPHASLTSSVTSTAGISSIFSGVLAPAVSAPTVAAASVTSVSVAHSAPSETVTAVAPAPSAPAASSSNSVSSSSSSTSSIPTESKPPVKAWKQLAALPVAKAAPAASSSSSPTAAISAATGGGAKQIKTQPSPTAASAPQKQSPSSAKENTNNAPLAATPTSKSAPAANATTTAAASSTPAIVAKESKVAGSAKSANVPVWPAIENRKAAAAAAAAAASASTTSVASSVSSPSSSPSAASSSAAKPASVSPSSASASASSSNVISSSSAAADEKVKAAPSPTNAATVNASSPAPKLSYAQLLKNSANK